MIRLDELPTEYGLVACGASHNGYLVMTPAADGSHLEALATSRFSAAADVFRALARMEQECALIRVHTGGEPPSVLKFHRPAR